MSSWLHKLSRHLLLALVLVNVLAPVQKAFACAPQPAMAMMMDMDCCPEPGQLAPAVVAQIEADIAHGDSCCVVELKTNSQLVAPQSAHADALSLLLAEPPWPPYALIFPVPANVPQSRRLIVSPPSPAAPATWGTLTYARTARLRI